MQVVTLPKILQSEKSFADTSGEWNLILVDRNHYIPDNYQVELTELSNGKKSRFTDITGISNEPWHYRYVGTTVAKIMKEENLCLEEYLEKYK